MLKFVVVLYKLPCFSEEQFVKYMREVHGPMAERLPGLQRYVQNFPVQDPKRKHPGWHAVIELFFTDRDTMESAWRSPEGTAATEDLDKFVDRDRSTWSVVEERRIR